MKSPFLAVDVLEYGKSSAKDRTECVIEKEIKFDTLALQSYFFTVWDPILFDALLVAAAVEFCDRTLKRSSVDWKREFDLRVPVHDPNHWNNSNVMNSLLQSLHILTGDNWSLSFVQRKKIVENEFQSNMNLLNNVNGVLPYSNGLDSLCVSGILEREIEGQIILIRLGSKIRKHEYQNKQFLPFSDIPYKVHSGQKESSSRSRGFKFATISAIAAYIAKADNIYIPESGQGALGPSLTTVGQAHPDYRTHPHFTNCMEQYFNALLGRNLKFVFPRLWYTKGQTLKKYIELNENSGMDWRSTISCWQGNRQVSVNGKKRQCGICAACMLRRLSIFNAELTEKKETYVFENLSASSLEGGCAPDFPEEKITKAMREYAIAGTLHLDHLAGLRSSSINAGALKRNIAQITIACNLKKEDVKNKLNQMLYQHESEWQNFRNSLGKESFINKWSVNI